MLLVARAVSDLPTATAAIREAVRAADPAIPLQNPRSVDDLIGGLTAQRQLNTLLLILFGVVAAALAVIGVYGVLGYSVSERTREIGVRVALGATRGSILRLVLTEGMVLAGIGIASGLASALALGRAMATLLYEVSPNDTATLAGIGLITAAAALLASLVPAVRAVRVAPTEALRAD
jgi:putative ABC transport system permease protein